MRQKPTGEEQAAPRRRRRYGRGLVNIILAAIIFLVGVNVGNGRIDLNFGKPPSSNKNLPSQLDYDEVNEVYRSLKENYDGKLSEEKLIEGLKHGLASASGDPYTAYFTPKEAQDFRNQLNNSFAGIGARLSKDADGYLTVGEAIAGFPAAKAGLKEHDIITEINGTEAASLALDDAILKIRGQPGTKVTLKVVRDRTRDLTFTITRQSIKLPSVTSKVLPGNIGYMEISSFSDDTIALAEKAAQQFQQQGVNGIILDLRDNPGGLLEASVKLASLWLPEGKTVLQEKRGNVVVNNYAALGGSRLQDIPTVVLINGGSASASEITAGALHDNHEAYLIGQKSYGKGVVQDLINFGDGSQLKVTIASWFRPNGQNINKLGITPDKTVISSDNDIKNKKDRQLEAAQAYLKTQ